MSDRLTQDVVVPELISGGMKDGATVAAADMVYKYALAEN